MEFSFWSLKAQIFQQEDPFEVMLWEVSKHMGSNQNHVKDSNSVENPFLK